MDRTIVIVVENQLKKPLYMHIYLGIVEVVNELNTYLQGISKQGKCRLSLLEIILYMLNE